MSLQDAMKDISYGGIAGSLAKIIEFPFDTIKVRLQSSPEFRRQSTFTTIQQTLNHEGFINGFYKGLKAPMVGACLESAVLFVSYNYANNLIAKLSPNSMIQIPNKETNKPNKEELPLWIQATSGGIAGFMASFVLTPVELVKCKLQVANLSTSIPSHSYTSMIKMILRNDGMIGLWRGLSSTIVRESGGTAIWFGTYELSVKNLTRLNPQFDTANLLFSGALAGVCFNLAMFPIDTIKSNIQTYDMMHNKDRSNDGMGKKLESKSMKFKPVRAPNFLETTSFLLKTGGIKTFYHGLGITLIRAVPANAMIFYVYELLKRTF